MSDHYTVALNLMDESFHAHDTRNYGLAILVNEYSIGFSVLDFRRNKFLGLQQFVLNDHTGGTGLATPGQPMGNFLEDVCTASPWLRNTFKLTKIAYDGKDSTLVPAALFDQGNPEQYIKFNYTRRKDEMVFSDHLMPLDAWQVFSVPDQLVKSAREIFPKTRMVHASSLLIESIWINYKNRISSPHVFLNVREHLFDVMIFNGRQMSYFNTFAFQNPEEVTYYLIFVLEQLNFNPETVPLVLLGNVDMKEGLPELLFRYVRHIEAGRRNEAYGYSYLLDQLPPQSCFTLLNFFSCGL